MHVCIVPSNFVLFDLVPGGPSILQRFFFVLAEIGAGHPVDLL